MRLARMPCVRLHHQRAAWRSSAFLEGQSMCSLGEIAVFEVPKCGRLRQQPLCLLAGREAGH